MYILYNNYGLNFRANVLLTHMWHYKLVETLKLGNKLR